MNNLMTQFANRDNIETVFFVVTMMMILLCAGMAISALTHSRRFEFSSPYSISNSVSCEYFFWVSFIKIPAIRTNYFFAFLALLISFLNKSKFISFLVFLSKGNLTNFTLTRKSICFISIFIKLRNGLNLFAFPAFFCFHNGIIPKFNTGIKENF